MLAAFESCGICKCKCNLEYLEEKAVLSYGCLVEAQYPAVVMPGLPLHTSVVDPEDILSRFPALCYPKGHGRNPGIVVKGQPAGRRGICLSRLRVLGCLWTDEEDPQVVASRLPLYYTSINAPTQSDIHKPFLYSRSAC